jgi:hypothetical protein
MKIMLLLFAVVMLVSPLPAAEVDLGSPTGSTPYDGYLGPMRAVLTSLSGAKPPVNQVHGYVRTGRGFRYFMKDPYVPQTPAETEATKAGDCKAKSLWVASKMNDRSVRYVIGKARKVSNISHAWLLWPRPEGGWLILDATNFGSPLDPAKLSADEFMPIYSYTASGKFAHASGASATKTKRYGDHL